MHIGKFDVDTLWISMLACSPSGFQGMWCERIATYVIQSGAVLRSFYNLNRRVVARLYANIGWQGDLGQTEGAWVGIVGRASDLEG